jgi:hypothetical protein
MRRSSNTGRRLHVTVLRALIPEHAAGQPIVADPEMQKNADGSVDVYFGPASPTGKSQTGCRPIPCDSLN